MGRAFIEIKEGLEAAIAHAKGEAPNVIEHKPEKIDVKAVQQIRKSRSYTMFVQLLRKLLHKNSVAFASH